MKPKLFFISRFLLILVVTLNLLGYSQWDVKAANELSVTPITWDILGLDSNNVAVGPNRFPVGARVCNTSASTVTNVVSNFVWENTDTTYLNLTPGTLTEFVGENAIPSLLAGECTDFYYEVTVTRDANAYNQSRPYHITADADGIDPAQTPPNRQLFIEHLVSQSRNATENVFIGTDLASMQDVTAGGSYAVSVGQSYYIQLVAHTAPGGYNELETFLNLSNSFFKINSVNSVYSIQDAGIDNSLFYSDSCGWENDYTDPNYRSCVVDDGKTGGDMTITYNVTIMGGAGSSNTINSLIYDFSGSSFHYNADYSSRSIQLSIGNDLEFSKSFDPATISNGGTSDLTFTITNTGGTSQNAISFTDNLPANVTVASPLVETIGVECKGSPLIDASGSTINISGLSIDAGKACQYTVRVTSSTNGAYQNTTSTLVAGGVDSGLQATAPLSVISSSAANGCVSSNLVTYTFRSTDFTASGYSFTSPRFTTNSLPTSPVATLGVGLKPYGSAPSASHSADSSITWGHNGANEDQKGNLDIVNEHTYYEFLLNTTGLDALSMSFFISSKSQGATVWNLFAYPEGELVTSNTSLKTGTIPTSNDGLTWSSDGTYTFDLNKVTPDINTSGNTVIRLYVSNAGANNSGVGDSFLDDVVFSGCQLQDPTIAKVFAPNIIPANGTSTLTFTLTNPNSYALTSATFTDIFPSGITLAADPAEVTTCTGGSFGTINAGDTQITFSGATIPAGSSCTLSVDVTSSTAGSYHNVSGPLSSYQTGTVLDAVAEADIVVLAPPQISKSFLNDPVYAGDSTTLVFTLTNSNPVALTNASFSDSLPAGLEVALTPSPVNNCGGTFFPSPGDKWVSLSGGTIPANGSCEIYVNVTVSATGVYNNTTSTLTTAQTNPGPAATDALNVVERHPAISLSKMVSASIGGPWVNFLNIDPASVGAKLYYRLIVENIGDVDLVDVQVNDPTLDVSGCSFAASLVSLPLTSPVLECVVGPFTPVFGSLTNTAMVTGRYSSTTVSDTDSAEVFGNTPATNTEATLTKQISTSPMGPWSASLEGIAVGSPVYYRFTIANTGNAPITLTDLADPNIPGLSLSTCSLNTSLAVGKTTSCVYSGTTALEGVHTNTASVTYNDGGPDLIAPSEQAIYHAGTGLISGKIWLDSNTDLVIDPLEQLLRNVKVTLYQDLDNNGLVDPTDLVLEVLYSELDGSFTFNNLPLTDVDTYNYLVVVTDPTSYSYSDATVPITSSGNLRILSLPAFAADSTGNNFAYTELPAPDLTISKNANNGGYITPDSPFEFLLTLNNVGSATAVFNSGERILTDVLPSGGTWGTPAVTDSSGVGGLGTISCSVVADVLDCIASGGDVTIAPAGSFGVIFSAALTGSGSINNQAQADPDDVIPDEKSETNNNSNIHTSLFTTELPDLKAEKHNDISGYVDVDNTFKWTMTVSNVGLGAAKFSLGDVILSDVLPSATYSNVQVLAPSINVTGEENLACSINAGILSCVAQAGEVIFGSGASLSVSVDVDPGTVGTLTNTVVVDPENSVAETSGDNNDATDIVAVDTSIADLSITKTNPQTRLYSGQSSVYTITVTNNGPGSVTGAVLYDPEVASLSKTSIACAVSPGKCVTAPSIAQIETSPGFVLPTLAAGEYYVLEVTATVLATFGNDATNSVTVTPPLSITDPDPSNNSATETDPVDSAADISVVKMANPAEAEIGADVFYSLEITNNGPDTATNIAITDILPADLAYVALSITGGDSSVDTDPHGVGLSWTINSLASGASVTLGYTVNVTGSTDLQNDAMLKAVDQIDPEPTNDSDLYTLPILTPSATPTPTETATPTETSTATPTLTLTADATATETATATPTLTLTADATATETPTVTNTVEPTATQTNTATATETLTNTSTPTATRTKGPTATRTIRPTYTAVVTKTVTATRTPTVTSVVFPSASPTLSPTATSTLVPTITHTATLAPSATASPTPAPLTLLGVSKRVVGSPVKINGGTWRVTYEITARNYSQNTLTNLQISDDLVAAFRDAGTPALPTTFSVVSLSSTKFTLNWPATQPGAFNGASKTNLLKGTDSLEANTAGTLLLVVDVVPGSTGPFSNWAIGSGSINGSIYTDRSTDGANPDPDGDLNPGNNSTGTALNFSPAIFDPPIGIKTITASGLPIISWKSVWINSTNIVALNAIVSDPIPVGSTFYNDGRNSGAPLPVGAPAGSLASGVQCLDDSLVTTTQYCFYEGPSPAYPRGRIVWQGMLGPDMGNSTEREAANEIRLSYAITVDPIVNSLINTASISYDKTGDGDFIDAGEPDVARSSKTWERYPSGPSELPSTGLGMRQLPGVNSAGYPSHAQSSSIRIVVPSLQIDAPVIGVPMTDYKWDISWLGNSIGYLYGTTNPGDEGNTVLTGHVTGYAGVPGPFFNLKSLVVGDEVTMYAYGQTYHYVVREVNTVSDQDTSVIENRPGRWVTLLTCKNYDIASDSYIDRLAVHAELVSVSD